MIKFKNPTEITIVTGFDEENDNITEEQTVVFSPNDEIFADIISKDGEYVDLEFKDGVAFGVLRDCFDEIE